MEYLKVGQVDIPTIGLGTFSLHGNELEKVIIAALGMGYSYFDTAYRYGNEEDIGRILATQKPNEFSSFLLSSKLSGLQYHGRKELFYLNRKTPKRALSNSLHKLGRKYIDIYLLHSPFSGFQKAYEKLLLEKEKGRIKVLGVSGFDTNQLTMIKEYCGVYPMINMVELHPYHSSRPMLDFCNENNIRLIARSPFAHGEILPLLQEEGDIRDIANEHQKSIPQIILRWIIQQGVVAIPRTKIKKHLLENICVFDFELSNKEVDIINMKNKNLSFGVVSKKKV